jgi:heme/copper-type cytochrome/quinol oxidase subunit 3
MIDTKAHQALSRDEQLALRNKRTGMTIFQISWIMVFVCLILVNLQIRANHTSWPPQGVAPLEPVLPTVATLLLLASGLLVRAALRAINAALLPRFFSQWRAAILLGAAFVSIMAFEWVMIPDSGQYGTVFRVMTAYHAVHALVIGLYMWRVEGAVRAGRVTPQDSWAVEAGTKLWYFVIVAWIMFFVVLYVL